MKFLAVFTVLATLVASAVGDVAGSTGVVCSGFTISLANIKAASDRALVHLNAGTQVGSNNYPHQFNNREGFTFNSGCRAPYYEYPVVKGGLYTGGDPGCDRVIIGTWDGKNARFCDAVTHCGASGNNFLLCSNT